MRVTTWLESILNANRIRPSRAKRRCWQKRVLAGYDSLEDRRLLAADTFVSLSSGTLTVTDINGGSNDYLTISFSASSYTIRDSSLALDTNIAGATGQGTTTLTVPASGVTKITFNTLVGDDTINVNSVQPGIGDFTVLGSPGDDTVIIKGDITFASNADLNLDLADGASSSDVDQIGLGTGANVSLLRTGSAVLVSSGSIALQSGSSITTVDGDLTLSANQQATPTAGSFYGVELNDALIETTALGVVTVAGRGGNSGNSQMGIYVHAGADIIGGTRGLMTVTGAGGASNNGGNWGVGVAGAGSTISSNGASISVDALGGGTGGTSYGIAVFDGGQVFATGSSTLTVEGTSGANTSTTSLSVGVYVSGANSRIGTVEGSLAVTGTGMGTETARGVLINGEGVISSFGAGSITIDGTGSAAGNSDFNFGVSMLNGTISSNTGAINVTATGGGDSTALDLGILAELTTTNAPIDIRADSMDFGNATITAGNGQTVTLRQEFPLTTIDLGSTTDSAANTLEISDAELDRISAGTVQIGYFLGGAITVSAPITSSNDLSLTTGAGITVNDAITMGTDRSFTANSVGTAAGIVLNSVNADISTSGSGSVSLTTPKNIGLVSGSSITTVDGNLTLSANQQTTPTSGSFSGIDVNGGLIEATGTGVVTVEGRGGHANTASQRGVFVRAGGDIIGGTSGLVTVSGIGGSNTLEGSRGVDVYEPGSMITSNGADISVIGFAGGNSNNSIGVSVIYGGQILATGSSSLVARGTATSGINQGVYLSSNAGIGTANGSLTIYGVTTGTGSGRGVYIRDGSTISATGIGSVTLEVTGNATGTGTSNSGLWIASGGNISSNTGAIDITATAGAGSAGIWMEDDTNLTGGGSIDLLSDDDILLSRVETTGTGQVISITSTGGSILDNGDSAAELIAPSGGVLLLASGIGTIGNSLETKVAILEAAGGSGGVFISNTGNLTIGGLGPTNGVAANNSNVNISQDGNITVSENITSSSGNVTLTATETIVVGADVAATGTGSVALTTPRNISLLPGSSITTVDGDLTLSANQQATPTAGDFFGIEIDNALIEATGMGVVTVSGTGGDDSAGNQRGVYIRQNGDIIGGTSGVMAITGNGGASSGRRNIGVSVQDSGSTITSNGAAVSVNGLGGGSGENSIGVSVFNGEIFATNLAPVTVQGTSSIAMPDELTIVGTIGVSTAGNNPGYRIRSEDGNLTVSGTGRGAVAHAVGILIKGGSISSTGSGVVSLDGTGSSTGTGTSNQGVRMQTGGVVSSNTGAINIAATAGAGSVAFEMGTIDPILTSANATITVQADSMTIFGTAVVTAGSWVHLHQTTNGTLIDVGGADAAGTLGLTDAELDRITADNVYIGNSPSGNLTVSAPISHPNDLTLWTGNAITVSDEITMATGKSLVAQNLGSSPLGISLATANADIVASGSGSVSLTTARNISLASGSSITTVDGDLTLSANQQTTPTSGNFVGVDVNGGLIQSTGTGILTVEGRGGDDAGGVQQGVYVNNGGDIIGGTNGLTTVSGAGGASTGDSNWGVTVFDSGSTISSNGSDISVTGLGGGSGNRASNNGVLVFSSAQIFATGSAAVTVNGTSFATTSTSSSINPGVYVGLNARIGTVDGSLTVTGTGLGDAIGRGIMILGNGLVSATGTGSVTIDGTGSDTGTGNTNYGLWLTSGGTVSSNTGVIDITAIGGAVSPAFKMDTGTPNLTSTNAPITVIANSIAIDPSAIITAGSAQTFTLRAVSKVLSLAGIDLGSTTDVAANVLEISDAELDRITAGRIQITAPSGILVSAEISSNHDLALSSVVGIALNSSITMSVDRSFTANSGIGGQIELATTSADIATSGSGSVTLTTRNISLAPGSSITTVNGDITLSANQYSFTGNFVGVDVNGGLIQSTGSGVVTVSGKGGDDSGGVQRGVYVRNGGGIIGGTNGVMTVSGTGGETTGGNNWGVAVIDAGSTITSNGADISVIGLGGGNGSSDSNYGVVVFSAGQIFATGSSAVTVEGTSFATTSTSSSLNPGVYVGASNSRIGTVDGSLSVTGTGLGTTNPQGIIVLGAGEISATGTGGITLDGTGSATGTGTSNYGLWMTSGGTVSSNTGAIDITAAAGAGSASISMNDGTSIVGGAIIDLLGDKDILLSRVETTGTGQVISITSSGGSILDNGDSAIDIIAPGSGVVLLASGVGTSVNSLETQVTNLEATGGTGGVFIWNTGDLTIGGIGATEGVSTSNADITIAAASDITISEDVTAGSGDVTLTATETIDVIANVAATGTGSIALSTPRNISLSPGSSISTVDGDLTLAANQQATPTIGEFLGIEINDGLVESTGAGVVTVSGRGGDYEFNHGFSPYGIRVWNGGNIVGGTSGLMTVTGVGGESLASNRGVDVSGAGSTITSNGAEVLLIGRGGFRGSNSYGVAVLDGGQVFTTGSAAISVQGTSSTSVFEINPGVYVGANAGIRTVNGNLAVVGSVSGAYYNQGIYVAAGEISATGNGRITLDGTSNPYGNGSVNNGVVFKSGATVSSNTGSIDITARGGQGSVAFKMGAGSSYLTTNNSIAVTADSMDIDGTAVITAGTDVLLSPIHGGTSIDVGGADDLQGASGTLGLTDAELDRISASLVTVVGGGNLTVSAPITHGNDLLLYDFGITINDAITMAPDKFFHAIAFGLDAGIVLATTSTDISTSGTGAVLLSTPRNIKLSTGSSITTVDGDLTLSANQQSTPTAGSFIGVDVNNALIEATGSGVVSIFGKGGDSGSSGGVFVAAGEVIGGTSGLLTITGIGNASASGSSFGVRVGLSEITSRGASVLVTGTGYGSAEHSYGIAVDLGGVISATNSGTVTLTGTGSSTGSGSNNYGVWIGYIGGVYSNTGAITINATAGTGSNAFRMDAGVSLYTASAAIYVFADSMDFDGSANITGLYVWLRPQTTGTLIDLGGGDVLGSTLGLTDVELDTITVADGVYIGDSSSGDLSVSAPITHGNDLNLLVTSAGITVRESITLATDKHFYGQSGVAAGIALSTAIADISTSGTGSVYLITPRNISLTPGSSITTVDGNLTLSANQQATPTSGNFAGVEVNNALIETTGTGTVRIDGKGGDDGNAQRGVEVANGGKIVGGTSGVMTVAGTGGASTGNSNNGVAASNLGSAITSNGADISVTGLAGGSGSSEYSYGVQIFGSAQIFATGSSALNVHGTSFDTTSTSGNFNPGVIVQALAEIRTVDGSLSVTGTGMGTVQGAAGVWVFANSQISATGTGDITLVGTGSATGTGNSNYGVEVATDSTVSSNTGAIKITAMAGAGSEAFKLGSGAPSLTTTNAAINLIADSVSIDPTATVTAGSGQTVTLFQQTGGLAIDLGGADVLGSTLGLTDAELDRVTAGLLQVGDTDSGTVTVSAPLTQGNDISLTTGGRIIVNESITMDVDRSFTANTTDAWRIFLATATADISTSGTGSVALTTPMDIRLASGSSITTVDGDLTLSANQQAIPTTDSFGGINIANGLIQVTGTGALTVEGKGGHGSSSQYGVFVNAGGDIIGGTSGVMTVTGTGGAGSGSGNNGVLVTGSGSTITSNGADVSVTGVGDGTGVNAYGVAVFSGGQIFSTGSVPVIVHGTSAATTATTNFGFGLMVSGTNSRVGTFDGILSVTGVGLGTTPRAAGIYVLDNAEISASGSGTINLNGTGSATGKGAENYGVWQQSGGTVSSNTGAIEITAIAGAESIAFKMDTGTPKLTTTNAPIAVIADSMAIDSSSAFTAGSTQTVTLRQKTNGIAINLGGADVLGSTLGLTGDELDQITADTIKIGDANSGNIMFSDSVSPAPATALNLNTGGDVVPMASGTDVSIGSATVGFEAGSDLNIVINGTTVDTQYQQLGVVGQVNLTGMDLVTSGSHTPVVGEQFVIVENDGGEAIVGTFNGLVEGAVISNFLGSSLSASISYLGIDGSTGNDAVLSVFTANLPPMVAGTPVINAGSPNRSGFGTIAISFNENVNFVGPGSLRLFNHSTSSLIDTSSITPTGDGTTELTWNISSIDFPSGRYTAELVNTQVEDLGGVPLASSYSFELFALKGDVDGDGSVNFNDYFAVSANFNQTGAPYTPGDADGDGSVNFNDYFAVSAGFNGNLGANLEYDFGDAGPDSATFPTLLLPNDGARHVITGNSTFLGTLRDAESDGQPTSDATGDDGASNADEDGISVGNLTIGNSVSVTVIASVPTTAFLNAWVDFNQDGDWDDVGEQVFTDQTLSIGSNSLSISVPGSAKVGSSLARFRITESAGYSYFGLAPNGEVEDYQVSVVASKGNSGFGDNFGDLTEGTKLGRVASTQPVMDLMFDSTDDEDRRWHPLNSAPAVIELAKPSIDDLAPIQMLESRKSNRVAVLDHLVTKRRVIDAAFASDEIEYDWMAVEKKTRVSGPTR